MIVSPTVPAVEALPPALSDSLPLPMPSAPADTDTAPDALTTADTSAFLGRLTRTALLSQDEEIALSKRIRGGGADGRRAQTRLVEANIRLVVAVAKMYRQSGIALEDLVQEGVIGLMTATERYDYRRGYRFSTYATQWIRQSIGRAVDNKAKSIRLPAHVSESLRKMERIRADYRRETGDEAPLEVLVARSGFSLRKVKLLTQTLADPVSLDAPIGDGDGATLGTVLDDKDATDPADVVATAEMRTVIQTILSHLDERERIVMRKRFGFDDDDAYVLQKIGDDMSLSRERVRQIEAQALRKLRTLARQHRLRDYLPG
ncbi:MAG: sigma-70 family RNA polymerase sigma factor [Armatimonadetes bacterium]|nr:sigma-70 family RNA polymerase sigma factor [Armatimonadota bacterium]